MICMIVLLNFKLFYEFHDSHVEFHDFHDFRDPRMEFYNFHDFRAYRMEFNFFMILMILVREF